MHYQRMHPQPHPNATLWRIESERRVYMDVRCHAGFPTTFITDLYGAEPWKCRDGEWYWRRHLPGEQS